MVYEDNRERILDVLNIKEVVTKYSGVEIGRHNRCACPMHGGEYNNFAVYPKTNSFFCFTCGKGGDLIKFVAYYFDLPYNEAIKKLDSDYRLGLYDNQHKSDVDVARVIMKRKLEREKQERFAEYQTFCYGLLLRYYKWLRKQHQNEAIQHDTAYIERLLDKHLNYKENPIQGDIWALIRALYSKHREVKTWK